MSATKNLYQKQPKLKTLDILKGIAIIMIILVHNRHFIMKDMSGFRQLINFGQMGCQIFFVVSGMSLCYSWTNQITKNKSYSTTKHYFSFMKRRLLRLAPGFWIIMLLNLLLNYILIDCLDYSPGFIMCRDIKGIALTFLFLHGFSKQYINIVFPGGWYIGTTVILYALFPILFSLFNKIYSRIKLLIILLPGLFLLFARIISQIVAQNTNYELYPANNTFMYYYFTTQLPGFVLGIVLYLFTSDNTLDKLLNSIYTLVFTISLSFVLGIISIKLFITNAGTAEYNYAYVYIPFLFSLCIFGIALTMIKIEKLYIKPFKNKHMLFLADCGKKSYGIYLVHGFISWYGIKAITLHLNNINYPYNDLLLYFLIIIPSIIVIYSLGTFFELFLKKLSLKIKKV